MRKAKWKKIKLIVCDIDGTMVGQSRFPTEETVRTIEKLMDRGYLFAVASGRPLEDLRDYCRRWNMKRDFDFIIAWNGAELYDSHTNESYRFSTLSVEMLKEIIDFMSAFECNIHMYRPGIYLSSQETDKAWYSAFKNKRQFVVADSTEEFYKEENCGIMFRTKAEDMPMIEKKIAEQLSDKDYVGMKTQPDLMEFAHKNANKGFGVMKICEKYHLDPDECMAFGDTTNDNSMLKICHGIVLKNGSEDTKALAEEITKKDVEEGGWIEYVQQNLL